MTLLEVHGLVVRYGHFEALPQSQVIWFSWSAPEVAANA